MQPSRKKTHRRTLDTVLEKGIVATAIAIVFLISPLILKGSPTLLAVANGLNLAGWWVLGLGLLLIALHLVMLRLRREVQHEEPEPPASRFQHSILPDELLYPPSRVRLEPMLKDAPEEDAPATDPYEQSTIPAQLDVQPEETPARPERELAWGPKVWTQIEWRRFEAVCEALFAQVGFQTTAQPRSGDGGVNIWLRSRNAQGGPVAVVQCKHWQRKPVGVKELRELLEAMGSQQLKRGTFAASGRFSRDALQFAQDHGVNVLDGAALLALIARRKPDQQQLLLNVAYEGEYWRPTCANCGTKMVERQVSQRGSAFWGCFDYPRCRNTLSIANAL